MSNRGLRQVLHDVQYQKSTHKVAHWRKTIQLQLPQLWKSIYVIN